MYNIYDEFERVNESLAEVLELSSGKYLNAASERDAQGREKLDKAYDTREHGDRYSLIGKTDMAAKAAKRADQLDAEADNLFARSDRLRRAGMRAKAAGR
jgi:hypothetical protein